jgi:hypothetical protein
VALQLIAPWLNVVLPKTEIITYGIASTLWGTPRIQSELHLLGFSVTEKTVAKYRVKRDKPPSQTWKTFLINHASQIAAVDFFTLPTINFRVLYCFIVLD